MLSRTAIGLAATVVVVALGSGGPIQAQDRYRLNIHAAGGNGQALKGARIKIIGPDLQEMHYPRSVFWQVSDLKGDGVATDDTGKVSVYVGPGQYKVKIWHKDYQEDGYVITVPPPDDPHAYDLDFRVKLTRSLLPEDPAGSRELIVTVLGSREAGSAAAEPLTGARVTVRGPAGRTGGTTGAGGVATIRVPKSLADVGDEVRVAAEKPGWQPGEQRLVLGAGRIALTTPRDRLTLTLRQQGNTVLIVDVLEAGSGAPVKGAFVHVETIEGGNLHAGDRTNDQGQTGPMRLLVTPSADAQPYYRARVEHQEYEDAWSDIPNELLQPRIEPRHYLVQLKPKAEAATGPQAHWTAAERAGFARFVKWAEGKHANAGDEYHEKLSVDDDSASVGWYEPQPGNDRLLRRSGYASLTYVRHEPGDPPPSPDLSFWGDEPLEVGGYRGVFDRKPGIIVWYQGWFKMFIAYNGNPRTPDPSPDEVLALANEVAGVVGNVGD